MSQFSDLSCAQHSVASVHSAWML